MISNEDLLWALCRTDPRCADYAPGEEVCTKEFPCCNCYYGRSEMADELLRYRSDAGLL